MPDGCSQIVERKSREVTKETQVLDERDAIRPEQFEETWDLAKSNVSVRSNTLGTPSKDEGPTFVKVSSSSSSYGIGLGVLFD